MRSDTRKAFLYQPKGKANETHAFIAGRTDGLYCVNHCTGCSHGCKYPCYARLIRKMKYEDWVNPVVHEDAVNVVSRELKRSHDVRDVELCFTTDPFMHKQPAMWGVSNALISLFRERGIGVTVLTKGDLSNAVERDHVNYGISIVSLEESFRRKWEPHTVSYVDRIAALKEKDQKGYPTWISVEPYPAKNGMHTVLDIIDACSFVDKAILGQWNYNDGIAEAEAYKAAVDDFRWTCKQYGIECMVKQDLRETYAAYCLAQAGELMNSPTTYLRRERERERARSE